MKNLFKNLMLVAVAAMAFTACTETNDEVNAVVEKTVLTFTANIADDTRSGFAEKEEGATAYKSEWFGDETLKVCANGAFASAQTVDIEDAEGHFTVEFEGAAPALIDVFSPASAWNDENYPTIPAVQTPRANSVDPAAHILKAQAAAVESGMVTMQHQVAYGKMTLKEVDFDIDHVVVELNGTYYGYAREYSYTINADDVENNTFWFATEPIDVEEFTVTAYDAEDNAVAKTVDMTGKEKPLAFNYGQVSTFSVSNLQEVVAPSAPMFTSAEYNGNTGDKIVMLYSDTLGELWMNFYGSNPLLSTDNWINPGQYGKGKGMYFGGNYGQYKPAGSSQFLTGTPNSFTLDVSIVDGKYKFVINADYTNLSAGVVLENATFIGEIPGLDMPDDVRTPLATPEVTYELNGKTLTLSWSAVDGAVGYYVHDYDNEINTTTEETTLTVELTKYQYYYIYVSAVAADDDANFKNSVEATISFLVEDSRTVLSAPSNVRTTVDGRYATIEWDAVEGADYYTLSYSLEGSGNQEVTVEEGTSHTIDVGFNVSNLYVYVFAKANDDNENYQSQTSWDAYVVVNTGKDPNAIADVMLSAPIAETYSYYGYCFKMNFTDDSGKYIRLFFNEADRPGNNSLKTGVYSGIGNGSSDNYAPGAGKFTATIYDKYGYRQTGCYARHFTSASTVNVSYDEAVGYTIVLTHDGVTYGYKGMPDGWVAASEGGYGDEGGSGDDSGDDFIQMTKLYYDSSASSLYNFILTNADQSCKLTLSFNNNDVTNNWIPVYTYTSAGLNAVNGSTGYFSLQYDSAKINGTSYTLGATGHTLKVISASNGGNHEMELSVVTSGGVEYKFKFSGSLGL